MTQIEQVQIPILLPKRGKGHQEVMASFSVLTSKPIDPLTFIPIINTYANKTCIIVDTVDMSKRFLKTLSLDDVFISISFAYMLDRVSSQLSPTFFSLPCFYERSVGFSDKNSIAIGVKLPMQAFLGKPISSSLTVKIEHPSNVFFEDIVDRVYKTLGAVLCPAVETKSLDQNPCYTPEETLKKLRGVFKEKKLGKGGSLQVETMDLYHMYKLTYTTSWKNN
jgi:hypothetical protein